MSKLFYEVIDVGSVLALTKEKCSHSEPWKAYTCIPSYVFSAKRSVAPQQLVEHGKRIIIHKSSNKCERLKRTTLSPKDSMISKDK